MVQSISSKCGLKRVMKSHACLHRVNHFLGEAIREENVVDFHSKAFSLAACHIHGNL